MAKKTAKRKASTKAKKSYRVPMQAILTFVRMLEQEGQLDKFIQDATQAKAALTMDAKAVGFVKKYLDRQELHPAAARAIRARPRDPCPCINR
jgi:hypothetical protein